MQTPREIVERARLTRNMLRGARLGNISPAPRAAAQALPPAQPAQQNAPAPLPPLHISAYQELMKKHDQVKARRT